MLTGRIKCTRGGVTLNGSTPLSAVQKLVGFVGQEDIVYPVPLLSPAFSGSTDVFVPSVDVDSAPGLG